MRLCRYCQTERAERSFLPGNNRCRECRIQKMLVYRAARIAEGRPYHKTKNGNRKRTPRQHRAHYMIESAVKLGILKVPEVCQQCGKQQHKSFNRLESHHWDYLKPLDVIWVCRDCHLLIHRSPNPYINAEGPIIPEVFRMPVSTRGLSQYFGVSSDTRLGWAATVYHDGKKYFAGRFVKEIDAAKAHDAKARELELPVRLNFPKQDAA